MGRQVYVFQATTGRASKDRKTYAVLGDGSNNCSESQERLTQGSSSCLHQSCKSSRTFRSGPCSSSSLGISCLLGFGLSGCCSCSQCLPLLPLLGLPLCILSFLETGDREGAAK
jgi:hypothetical protein